MGEDGRRKKRKDVSLSRHEMNLSSSSSSRYFFWRCLVIFDARPRTNGRAPFVSSKRGRIWIAVGAWNVFTSDWKNGRNADEEGFIFDKVYVCVYIYIYSYKIVPREGSSKVGITRARPLIGLTRICPNTGWNFWRRYRIDSWNSYRSPRG